MKKVIKFLGIIAFVTVIMSTFIVCGPPKLKGTVNIDGDPMLGNTLTVNTSSLGGSGIISYQWMRNGATVDNMVGTAYKLEKEDKDAAITVTVIRSDNTGSVTSAPVTAYGYFIGEIGPGGGIVFYRKNDGFIMTDTSETAYYLEVVPFILGNLPWASSRFTRINIAGTESSIGAGRKNTALILAVDADAPAASYCKILEGDWYLPSLNELTELYEQSSLLDIEIKYGYFWTSDQYNNGSAVAKSFSNAGWHEQSKNDKYPVLAIRAF